MKVTFDPILGRLRKMDDGGVDPPVPPVGLNDFTDDFTDDFY